MSLDNTGREEQQEMDLVRYKELMQRVEDNDTLTHDESSELLELIRRIDPRLIQSAPKSKDTDTDRDIRLVQYIQNNRDHVDPVRLVEWLSENREAGSATENQRDGLDDEELRRWTSPANRAWINEDDNKDNLES